jgi:hypothetical protein
MVSARRCLGVVWALSETELVTPRPIRHGRITGSIRNPVEEFSETPAVGLRADQRIARPMALRQRSSG